MKTTQLIPFAIAAGVSLQALAESSESPKSPDTHETIEEVLIQSDALTKDMAKAHLEETIDQEALKALSGNSIGELLKTTPGMANASFGQGVGQLVFRGLTAQHLALYQNTLSLEDISQSSPDHASMIEPSEIDSIKIIKGPETLLYGGGNTQGIVNIDTKGIYASSLKKNHAELNTGLSSNNNGKWVNGEVAVGTDHLAIHLDGFTRKEDNYESAKGEVLNSDSEASGGRIGFSLFDEDLGYVGIAVQQLDYDYAVPNTEGEDARVTPKQTLVEVASLYRLDNAWISNWHNRLSFVDYKHEESHGEITEGLFEKNAAQWKSWIDQSFFGFNGKLGLDVKYEDLALCHSHEGCDSIGNYNEPWNGKKGDHFETVDGYDLTHGTPLPLSETLTYGLFAIEGIDWDFGYTEFGARFDHTQMTLDPNNIEPDERQAKSYYDDKSFNTLNLSISHLFELSDQQGITWIVTRTERAPSVEEMYYNGEHHATFSYQLDNPYLDTEKGLGTELIWEYKTDQLFVSASVFYTRFDNFIFNQAIELHHDEDHSDDEHEEHHEEEGHEEEAHGHEAEEEAHGEEEHGHEEHEHDEPTYRHAQAPADLYGIEFQIRYQPSISIPWTIEALADGVRGRLRSGDDKNLPRIPPVRIGLATTYRGTHWFAQADVRHHFKQFNTAIEEPASKAYTTLNMQARYTFPIKRSSAWVAIKGQNLTDSYGENATSYLKTIAPIMGRNVQLELGLRY